MDQNNTYTTNHQEEEFEETLSFCDLSLENYQDSSSPSSPSDHPELFEFPNFITTPNYTSLLNLKNDIVFCGKLIKEQEYFDTDDDHRKYLFPLSSSRLLNNNKKYLGSLHLADSKPNYSALSTKSSKSQTFSSSSSPPRKHRPVLIGLAKVPSKMELSDIKKRQSRRVPSPMFPPVAAEHLEVMTVADGCGGGGGRGHHWGLSKPLRCRSGHNVVSALAKAMLGCIPHV